MIKTLLDADLTPSQLINRIKTLNMSAEVKKLANQLPKKTARTFESSQQAEILRRTNTHTGTLTLHCNEVGNISLKTPDNAPAPEHLYSVPGNSVLFSINAASFSLQLYKLEDEHLTRGELVIVDAGNPLFIDGTQTLFDSNVDGTGHSAFIGSVNFPDKSADIYVFDRVSLQKIAWFPHDDSAARYLVSLELLEAAQDPDASRVAEELIYHYHPAVAWKAFQIIHLLNPATALGYAPLLRNLQNTRLNELLDQHGGEIA
ncbi:hypothetical protein FHW68_000412 [Pseudomonas sp. Tn43]|uniref:hypothetical protein n=1 Tax=Pseudomonas sp. Tn43 TaxID=701213 RepID=UPI0016206AAC|nr:hypothetical protein [Pseudomonas sp. Tn43]MBB3238940.1 hypothetical protein [Pseudomonas sp. Tn43]